jgi:hypothetical protein
MMDTAEGSVCESIVVYRSTLPGVQWEPLEIPGDHQRVHKTVVEASKEGKELSIKIFYDGSVNISDAREFTDDIASRTVNRLAYHLDAFIEEPRYIGGSLTNPHI